MAIVLGVERAITRHGPPIGHRERTWIEQKEGREESRAEQSRQDVNKLGGLIITAANLEVDSNRLLTSKVQWSRHDVTYRHHLTKVIRNIQL